MQVLFLVAFILYYCFFSIFFIIIINRIQSMWTIFYLAKRIVELELNELRKKGSGCEINYKSSKMVKKKK